MNGWKRALGLSFEILYPYVVYVCVTAGISAWGSEAGWKDGRYVLLLSAALTGAFLGLLYQKKYGIQKISLKEVIFAAGLACSACLFWNLLLLSKNGVKSSEEIYEKAFWLQMLTAGICTPIVEELIFRGLAYRKLREVMSFFPAAFLSSLLFGFYHGHLLQGIYAASMGFLFAWLAEKEAGIVTPVTAHIAANLLSLILTKAGTAKWLMEHTLRRAGGILLSGMFFVCFFYLKRKDGERKQRNRKFL